MQFVIDETSWKYNHQSDDSYFAELLACLEFIQDRLKTDAFFMCEDLFTMEIIAGKTFFELWDRSGEFQIPRRIQEVFSVVADRIGDWSKEMAQPSTGQVTLKTTTFDAPSIAWSAENKRQGRPPIACLALPSNRDPGEQLVAYSGADECLFFIASEQDDQPFARFEMLCTCKAIPDLETRASRAFKGLEFRDGVFSGIKDMSKEFALILPSVVRHLSVLSDQGSRLFAGPAQQGFEGLALLGITASDENGNTKGNAKAMKQRTKEWNGKQVPFLWHTKIEPDRDRIHFFKDDDTQGRLVIGIFHRHLD